MKAMILAAGLGTRLRPLTNDRPKALVELGGRTLLEITIARLREFGANEIIVNAHHFADLLTDYITAHDGFGVRIEVSREDVLLDTGGGLKKAEHFFREGPGSGEPFYMHNVDVVSSIDLRRMLQQHSATRALATLAVQNRNSSRYLLFDADLRLCGRRAGQDEIVRHAPSVEPLAFSGVHVLSPRIFDVMHEEGVYSIVDAYLRLAHEGESIRAFRADDYYWRDLGRPESLAQAEEELRQRAPSN